MCQLRMVVTIPSMAGRSDDICELLLLLLVPYFELKFSYEVSASALPTVSTSKLKLKKLKKNIKN